MDFLTGIFKALGDAWASVEGALVGTPQLAGIGQGDNENISPATTIDFQVASERAAESWRFLITGIESITLDQGELQTWRFTRIPRPGTFERRLDVWLSPTHNWSPVRIRDTETNGTFTEMSMTNFTPL